MCGPCSSKALTLLLHLFLGFLYNDNGVVYFQSYANDSSLQHHLWNVCLTELQSAAAVPKLQT